MADFRLEVGFSEANMKWLIGIVVLVLLVVSVRFRKFVLGFVALGAAVGGVVYLTNEREESRSSFAHSCLPD